MNNKISKLCRHLAVVALVLQVPTNIIYDILLYTDYGLTIDFLDVLSYVPNIMIAISLFASAKTPLIIGCGMQGAVSAWEFFRFVFNGGNISDPSVILWLATAVCYVLIAVSLSHKKSHEKTIPIAIIVGIVGAILHYFLLYKHYDSIGWKSYYVGSGISSCIKTYVCLLIGILALEEKDVPIAGNNISASAKNPIETITKLKELLDIGAISQEEFDEKKKQLLNL